MCTGKDADSAIAIELSRRFEHAFQTRAVPADEPADEAAQLSLQPSAWNDSATRDAWIRCFKFLSI